MHDVRMLLRRCPYWLYNGFLPSALLVENIIARFYYSLIVYIDMSYVYPCSYQVALHRHICTGDKLLDLSNSIRVCSYESFPFASSSVDRYEGYPRHYTKETVTVKDAAGAEIPVMVYIMAEPYCRQPALPSPYYYRVIQRGFEANGLPVESLQAAWSRTIDEVWSGRIDKPKRAPERNRGPER